MRWGKTRKQDLFDNILEKLLLAIPWLGPIILEKYEKIPWFNRFVKFGVSTTLIFWLVKGPMIWMFNLFMPNISLVFIVIPDYLFSTFIAGLILTIIGFVINEGWIWKND